jgi:hypothetical protein
MDSMSFSEPGSVSSRQFLTQSYTQFSSDGADYFYKPGQSTRIEIAGQSQNSFILPRTMRLVYHAVSNIQTFPDGSPDTPPLPNSAVSLRGPAQFKNMPGVAKWGAAHLGSVQTEVPGLSSNMSSLLSDGQSQRLYAQRLFCSGDVGSLNDSALPDSYKSYGRSFEAGGKSLLARASAVTGTFWRAYVDGTVSREQAQGGWGRYVIPASAFFDLCDGASSVIPLPYLTSSSANLLVRINWAPAPSAVSAGRQTDASTGEPNRAADAISYTIGGVSLEWTAVNVIDSSILASIEQLFRGQVSIPVMEGVSVPVPMTLSHRAYRLASSTLSAGAGSFSLRVPAGKACCDGVLLQIQAAGETLPAAIKPIVRNLVLRVGSARFPAREISDIYVPDGVVPRGLQSDKWALVTTNPADALNTSFVGSGTYIPTADGRASEMYREARQFFSFWDDDKYDAHPAAEAFDGSGNGPTSVPIKLGGVISVNGDQGEVSYIPAAGGPRKLDSTQVGSRAPNMWCFSLQSFLPEDSMRERGYQLTGVDLRNQCDVTIEGEILGTAPLGVNVNQELLVDNATSWDISAVMSYREMATLLPSRTDLEASASLLPSAAGSVASGGGAAGI